MRIDDEMKNGNISRFHLIYGEEAYLITYYRNKLISKLSMPDDEMNKTIFQGDKILEKEIEDMGSIVPFMANNRLIVVKNSGFFKKSSDIVEVLEKLPQTTYIIFSEKDVDKRNKAYKWIKKNGCETECAKRNPREIQLWVATYLSRYGKKAKNSTIEYFILRIGSDMVTLENELNKLISYVGTREVIEVKDIDDISSGMVVSKVFEMIDNIAEKNKSKALRLYNDLMINKESPMSILYLITRHINILLQVKEFQARAYEKNTIADKIGISSYFINKYISQAKHFTVKQLLKMLEDRAKIEEDIKIGNINEQMGVELFLIGIL